VPNGTGAPGFPRPAWESPATGPPSCRAAGQVRLDAAARASATGRHGVTVTGAGHRQCAAIAAPSASMASIFTRWWCGWSSASSAEGKTPQPACVPGAAAAALAAKLPQLGKFLGTDGVVAAQHPPSGAGPLCQTLHRWQPGRRAPARRSRDLRTILDKTA
jgi:hypothetical protein